MTRTTVFRFQAESDAHLAHDLLVTEGALVTAVVPYSAGGVAFTLYEDVEDDTLAADAFAIASALAEGRAIDVPQILDESISAANAWWLMLAFADQLDAEDRARGIEPDTRGSRSHSARVAAFIATKIPVSA